MLYNYGPILNFDDANIASALEYFKKHEEFFISSMIEIDEINSKVQDTFDISHPNISFLVMSYVFNKNTVTLDVSSKILLSANGNIVSVIDNEENSESANSETVVCLTNTDKGVNFLSEFFLSRSLGEHKVYWLYDVSSPSIFPDITNYADDDIPPFKVLASVFFLKRLETFETLFSIGSSDNDTSIFTKYTGETYFNNLMNANIVCSTENVSGDSISITNEMMTFQNNISVDTNSITFEKGYVYEQRSPVSAEYGESAFAYNTLENVNSMNIYEIDINERADEEIITKVNFLNVASLLYDKERDYINDDFKVAVSRDGDASTFKSLLQTLTTFLNSFYIDKIKLFLSNYIDFGAISELIKYIQDKIEELKNNFVENTECDIPLDNIDEGCEIHCDHVHLEEPKLMVTKQKLKSIVRCALMCDTMPYTEEDLASAIIYPASTSSTNPDPVELPIQ